MNQAVYGAARGLGATPQYTQFQAQMPTFSRPQMAPPPPSGGFGRFPMQALSPQPAYRIPYGPSIPQRGVRADPNLAAINQAFAPRQAQYDSDGNSYNAPVYIDQSQRDAILANPGAYLEYAQYVQGGGDPAKYVRQPQPQPISMMCKTQQDALIKKQKSELDRLLPQARVEEYSGGA